MKKRKKDKKFKSNAVNIYKLGYSMKKRIFAKTWFKFWIYESSLKARF